MKIAFWSNVHGQTGATSNLLAVSAMDAIVKKRKVAVLQSHFSLNNLKFPLLGGNLEEMEEAFQETGLDALIRDYKSAPLTREVVQADSISLLNKQYNLYLGTGKTSRELYEDEMVKVFNRILDELAKYHEDVFVDVASGHNPLSDAILSNVDATVVNLSQNRYVLYKYFKDHSRRRIPGSLHYLVGNYNEDSKYRIKNLEKMYPEMKRNCSVMPFDVDYHDAQNDGTVIPFLLRNETCEKGTPHYALIQAIKKTIDSIHRKGGEET